MLKGGCIGVEKQNRDFRSIVGEIPTLKSARLTFGPIRRKDIPQYNELLMDTERNRLWGYDDAAAFGDDTRPERFYEDAQKDFNEGLGIRFGVRLDYLLLGEVELHDFAEDTCEIGFRIDTAHAGSGYGYESYDRLSAWAMETFGFGYIVARGLKENEGCRRVLEKHPDTYFDCEDEHFFQYRRKR
jgi:RimJ/RimL family protein N-acetyltransferase